MDEGLSKAVIKVFVELHREGLIYKDKRLVNWDTKLLTAISDLEVQQTEVKGHLWYLRYPIEGKTFSPEDPSSFIVVATTRPETMRGQRAVIELGIGQPGADRAADEHLPGAERERYAEHAEGQPEMGENELPIGQHSSASRHPSHDQRIRSCRLP